MQIPDDIHARIAGRYFLQVKKDAPDANDEPLTKECRVCNASGLQTDKGKSQKTTKITVLECIITWLIILEVYFTFYSYNSFRRTNMPEHLVLLKTVI